jgi:isoleucyl-tRNA synthetase
LSLDTETVELLPEEVVVNPQPRPGFAVATEGGVVVALDTAITPELRAEGLAREVVRRIQDLRKSARFDISDRVVTHYVASSDLAGAIAQYAGYVKTETLSVDLISSPPPAGAAMATDQFDGESLIVGLVKSEPPKAT